MDIDQIRMMNYRALMVQFRARPDQSGLSDHGFLKRFAEHAGLSAHYLSHINSGRKNIGDAFARKLEVGFGLPHGWMDNHHEADIQQTTDAEQRFMSISLNLYRESPIEAQQMLMDYLLRKAAK